MAEPGTAIEKYGRWTPEQVAEDEAQADKKTSEWLSFTEGITRVRFIPGNAPGVKPLNPAWQHRVKIPGRKDEIIINCRDRMLGEKCPVCETMKMMKKSRDSKDRENAEDLFPKFRVFAQVAVRVMDAKGAIKDTVGPLKTGFGKTIFDKLVKLAKNPDYGDITDPSEHGFDIEISRQGTGKSDTKYDAIPCRKSLSLGDLGIIDRSDDMSIFAEVPSYEKAVAMLKGEDKPKDREYDGPREPRGRSATDDIQQDKVAANQQGGPVPGDDDVPF